MHIRIPHTRATQPIIQSLNHVRKQCDLQQVLLKPKALAQVIGVLSLKLQALA